MRRIAAFAFAAGTLAQVAASAGAQAAAPARGLWIGPIQACSDTAESTVLGPKEHDPFGSLLITLAPKLRATLRRETARLIGGAMPIRLDGKLISAPIVYEPITGGILSLGGIPERETNAIQAAIRWPC